MAGSENPGRDHHDTRSCRLDDERLPAGGDSVEWSIHPPRKSDRPGMEQLRSQGTVLADDRDVVADACTGQDGSDVCHAWVARHHDQIIGLVTLAVSKPLLARVTMLVVDPSLRDSRLPAELLGQSLQFCRDTGILKVVLSTHLPAEDARPLFEKCGFGVVRDRRKDGRHVMDFYADLYKQADCERPQGRRMARLRRERKKD